MENHDPNTGYVEYSVELTYQQWEYIYKTIIPVRGNIKGMRVLQSAILRHAEQLNEEVENDSYFELVFTDPKDEESRLLCCVADSASNGYDDDLDIEAWLESVCVKAEIIEIKDY